MEQLVGYKWNSLAILLPMIENKIQKEKSITKDRETVSCLRPGVTPEASYSLNFLVLRANNFLCYLSQSELGSYHLQQKVLIIQLLC